MIVLKILGGLVLAVVLLIASYVFVFSGSSHTPVNVLKSTPYSAPQGPIIVFGGTRGVGLAIVRLLKQRGEDVTVSVRASSNTEALTSLGVRTVVANALNAEEVTAAMASAPYKVVISTLGTSRGDQKARPDYVGNRNVIDAAKAAGVQRFVFITVVGAGDSHDTAPLPARRALKEVMQLKTQAEDHLRASGLTYTIIRPGGLGDVKATGKAFLAADPQAFSYIARADLAQLTVDAIGNPQAFNRTFAAYDPGRKTLWTILAD